MTEKRPRIGIIGAGKVGTALGFALARAGYEIGFVASKNIESARRLAARVEGCSVVAGPQDVVDAAELILITTPDGAIGPLAEGLQWRPGVAAVHTSGAVPASVLAVAESQGAAIGALHPLQTFASVEVPPPLDGIVYATEAEGRLRETLLRIVADLGGRPLELRAEDRALYHASAVFVSNINVTLMKVATDLRLRFGWERRDAVKALLPLLQGTVGNLETLGIPAALTGPVARGDADTVRRHISALRGATPELAEFYRALTEQTLIVALAKGTLSEAEAGAIRSVIESSQEAAV